jgi:hypothetical protein
MRCVPWRDPRRRRWESQLNALSPELPVTGIAKLIGLAAIRCIVLDATVQLDP